MRATVIPAVLAAGITCAPPAQADGNAANLTQIVGNL